MNPSQSTVYIITDESGDIHAAATTYDMASAILEKDVADGQIKNGFICKQRLYVAGDVI